MPPKKESLDVQQVLQELKRLSDKVDHVVSSQEELTALTREIKFLREDNERKQRKIESLEMKVESLEQYTRKDDLIITGLRVTHQSYARAASANKQDTGDSAPQEELDSLEKKVVSFLESKGMEVNSDNISACHTLGKGQENRPANIVVRFSNRKEKARWLKQGKKLKNTGVYINEHLTKRNVDIAKHARKLRKDGDIEDSWTRSCAIFVRLKDNGGVKKISGPADFGKWGLRPMQTA